MCELCNKFLPLTINLRTLRARLLPLFKQQFSVFKQHYTYFYTLFHSHVFLKNISNVSYSIGHKYASLSLSVNVWIKLKSVFSCVVRFPMNPVHCLQDSQVFYLAINII